MGRRGSQAPVNHRAEPEPSTTKTHTMQNNYPARFIEWCSTNGFAPGPLSYHYWMIERDAEQ